MKRLGVLAIVGVLVLTFVASASAYIWFQESNMVDETNVPYFRSSFIIDHYPATNHYELIPRDVFLSPGYLDYYVRHQFDRNFFT